MVMVARVQRPGRPGAAKKRQTAIKDRGWGGGGGEISLKGWGEEEDPGGKVRATLRVLVRLKEARQEPWSRLWNG